MSVRGIASPTKTETTIHLYRHLLREASYLHPVAQAHVADRICQRFRHHVHTADPKAPLRQGRHDLRFLRAANSGDLRRMRRVLLAVFGRIGPGRRELSGRFVKKEPPSSLQELERAIQDSQAEGQLQPQDWLVEWDQQKIKQLAISQAQKGLEMAPKKLQWPQADPARSIRTATAWGKPLSPQASRRKLLKRWKLLMNKVLFPMPLSKWDLLQDLSEGKLRGQEWNVPPRRTPARPVKATDHKTAEKKDNGKDWTFTWGQVGFQVPQATPGQMGFFAGTDGRKKEKKNQQAPLPWLVPRWGRTMSITLVLERALRRAQACACPRARIAHP